MTAVKRDGEVGLAYMKSFEREERIRKQGEAEGKAEGEAIGETRMRMLINRLIADGRMDEIGKIIDSAEACRELYKEYGL